MLYICNISSICMEENLVLIADKNSTHIGKLIITKIFYIKIEIILFKIKRDMRKSIN